MPFDDLRQWIAALDRAGELKHIQTEADPILEIAEITDRVSKSKTGQPGGPALLFENIKNYPGSQLLINQFGSEGRMKLALGVNSFDEFANRIRVFMDLKSPQGFLDKLKMLPLLTEAGKFFPKTVPTGPCKEVIKRDNFSLLDFPILQCWPQDGGPGPPPGPEYDAAPRHSKRRDTRCRAHGRPGRTVQSRRGCR